MEVEKFEEGAGLANGIANVGQKIATATANMRDNKLIKVWNKANTLATKTYTPDTYEKWLPQAIALEKKTGSEIFQNGVKQLANIARAEYLTNYFKTQGKAFASSAKAQEQIKTDLAASGLTADQQKEILEALTSAVQATTTVGSPVQTNTAPEQPQQTTSMPDNEPAYQDVEFVGESTEITPSDLLSFFESFDKK